MMNAPIRLLLVDDDQVDRENVTRSLRRSGLKYELKESYDFGTALEALENYSFDCVLLDHHLPGRNGVEVLRAMPTVEPETKPAVIFLTHEDNEELALEVMASGAIDYLNKSEVSPSLLRRAIRYAFARQNFLREITELGRKDSLTGLPNRAVFSEALPSFIAQATHSNTTVATLLLDLDNFKDINDTMGHPAGDKILRLIASRLVEAVRDTDIVMRLGGDEFIVIAPTRFGEHDAAKLAKNLLKAVSEPIHIDDRAIQLTTSIGIALAPHDGNTSEKVLKSTDLALYKAKGVARGEYCFFDKSLDKAAHYRQEVERDMRLALEREEFELYYQPKISACDGTILGAEALIRWNHPDKGLVSPDDFIPIAEANQFITQIGDWVLSTASKQVVSWNKAGLSLKNCSINLSPTQVSNTQLLDVFDSVISETGIDPTCLEIEITESALMNRIEAINGVLGKLRDRGVAVSIDDFGTGYSSLVHLQQLQLDKLKIDRTFVANIDECSENAAFAGSIVAMGQSIGLEIIAEGVETAEQLAVLRNLGCDSLQGYFFSRPLPADQFFDWCKTRVANW